MFFRWILTTVLWLFIISDINAAKQSPSIDSANQQLEEINNKIQTLNNKNLEREGELGKIQLKLQETDKLIAAAAKNLIKIDQQMHSTQESLHKLGQEKNTQSENLQHHQSILAEQLRGLHRSNELIRLMGLAKPQSLNQYLRNQTYFHYLQQARAKRIAQIHQQQASLQQTERTFASKAQELKQLSTKALKKREALTKEKDNRQQTAKKLTENLKSSQKELTSLDANRKQLNELIERLRFVKADPKKKGPTKFADLKGKLRWPVEGIIAKSSSTPGVTIHTKEGLEVRAVSGGQVVFSDWMRGFGLLTIINHGDGYMSLYGNNQSLFKKPGESVQTGAIISTTGRSGGKQNSGLYFEVRKNAKPQDPYKWCQSS
jgi:septal ring factor EnvC (AmiA/AmiB activator)